MSAMEYQRDSCRKCLTMGMLQFLPHRKSLFFHLPSHSTPDLPLPGQLHLHQHWPAQWGEPTSLCQQQGLWDVAEKGRRDRQLRNFRGWKFLPWFGLFKVSPHESIIYLSAGHTCRHMSQLAVTCVLQALWHHRKTDLTLRISYYIPF